MMVLSARALDALLTEWRSDLPAYAALADRIRLLVLDGRIPLGTRLPAERDLAGHLGVSRTTITATYGELRDSGYLTSVRGSGSVTRLPGRPQASAEGTATGYLDFTKATLPATPLLAPAAVRAAKRLPEVLGQPGFDPVGLPELREALAARYSVRGLPTTADQIMVTIGAQHAIALLARVLVERGDAVMVEAPSYPHAYEALRAAGGRLMPVSVASGWGWDQEAIAQTLRRSSPSMAYLMPDFHNPTGEVMAEHERERMLDLAAARGTIVIADETMAELDIDSGTSVRPLPAYGAAVAIGSLGKSVWGGVRIGWIRAEPGLIQRLVRARSAGDLGTPLLEQLIAIDVLGDYDEILAHRREQLRTGREHLETALAEHLPDWSVPHVHGGLTTWIGLGHPVSSQLTLAARAEGLLLASGPRFGLDGAFERFLRIPIGYGADETDAAIAALARAWQRIAGHPMTERDVFAEVV